jgi:general secretion pathway protein I
MKKRAAQRRQPGFTLIEVLVALAIVAITLGAGVKAAGSLSSNAERLAQITQAQWCAENQLTGIRLRIQTPGALPSVGDSDFACDELGRSYAGKLVVRPTPNPNFRRVDALVASDDGTPLITISTVVSNR